MSESSYAQRDRALWPRQRELNVVVTVDGGVVKCDVLSDTQAPRRRDRSTDGFPGKSLGEETTSNKKKAGVAHPEG